MGLFDGMFGGGFSPTDMGGGAPMAINQDGANGQSPFSGMFGGGGQGGIFGQGGGLLGLGFGGQNNKPLYDLGGQGSGLLGFGSPGQGGMNPAMRYGLGVAGMGQPQQQQQLPPALLQMLLSRQNGQQAAAPTFNPHQVY